MRSFIVGGAGFIGSHLADQLVLLGPVTLYDNLSVGKTDFVAEHLRTGAATLVAKDALDLNALTEAVAGHDVVFHLAANPDRKSTRLNSSHQIISHAVFCLKKTKISPRRT